MHSVGVCMFKSEKQRLASSRNMKEAQKVAVAMHTGSTKAQVKRVCETCGKEFSTYKSRVLLGRGKNCSRKCNWIANGKKLTGYKHSLETRMKCAVARRGEKNWAWKGGNRSLVSRIRHSLIYRLWRQEIYRKDDYTCAECGTRGNGNRFEVHHIISFALLINKNGIKSIEDAEKCSELWDINNAVVLCRNCHKKTLKKPEHGATIKYLKEQKTLGVGKLQ